MDGLNNSFFCNRSKDIEKEVIQGAIKNAVIPFIRNNIAFERMKAPRFDDLKLGCIGLILPNLRSSNPGSFDAAEIQSYF